MLNADDTPGATLPPPPPCTLFPDWCGMVTVLTGDTYGVPEDFIGVGVVISPRPPADFSEPGTDPSRPPGPRQ